ncbi:MAG: hypothetical protein M1308_04885 [Actinobacteria bacterium]|nr:hypothetical protein [Actinomycetota bacterium]
MNIKKHFYSHLIDIESSIIQINEIGFSEEEKNHLILLIQANLHHLIIDIVLSELKEEDKKVFLMHLSLENNSDIWQFLSKKTNNIENKIKKTAEELKKEISRDINEIKFLKSPK